MNALGFTLFDTPIGQCGIAWSKNGIVRLQLPESGETETHVRLIKHLPGALPAKPPKIVQQAITIIRALLNGRDSDLSAIRLDMEGLPPFHRRVYEVTRSIPPGQTLSYGGVAEKMGAKGAARAVGQALGRNPFAIVVPCHRVLAAGGKVGGFSAQGGVTTKLRILAIEGVVPKIPRSGTALSPLDEAGAFPYDTKAALKHLRKADPVFGRLIDAIGPFRMELQHTSSLFNALARAIVFQQLHGKAASTIFNRVLALFPGGKNGLKATHILCASDEQLRGAGLSRSKMASLRDLARREAEGEIPNLAAIHKMDNEAIIESLTKVRGIGRWTVEMLLIFRLGRPDVLPIDDFGVRKGYSVAFGADAMPTPKALAEYGTRWAPYRSVASWYLWRVADLKQL